MLILCIFHVDQVYIKDLISMVERHSLSLDDTLAKADVERSEAFSPFA